MIQPTTPVRVEHGVVGDEVLGLRLLTLGLDPGTNVVDLAPEGLHVDDEVLDDRQVAGRLDADAAVGAGDAGQLGLAREGRVAVDAHGAGAADGGPAGAPESEAFVDLLPDVDQGVQHREVLGHVKRIGLEEGVRGLVFRVEALDLERDLHQYFRTSGCHWVIVTGVKSMSGPSSVRRALVCFR